MYPNLENYLEEISHYLVPRKGAEDVLAEIRSHILEKAGQELGGIGEENLARVIAGYGSPPKVAERYMEGESLIAPTLKGYLLRYTGILFVIHLAVILAAFLLKTKMVLFPFLYIPRLSGVADLFYLPTAFIYDLGLVGIFLYFVTKQAKEVHLPWFDIHFRLPDSPKARTSEPKVYLLILMLIGFGMLLGIYLRFETLFMLGIGPEGTRPLFRPAVAHWYSLALLALIGVGIGSYIAQFFTRSEWVQVVKNAICLLIAGIVNIYPLEWEPSRIPVLSERTFGTAFVLVVVFTSAYGLCRSLFRIGRRILLDAFRMTNDK